MSAQYEAGRILHDAWYNVGRAIAPPFDLIDKFDRLRWIEAAKISNSAEREACAKICDEKVGAEYATGKVDHNEMGWTQSCVIDIRARGNT